MSSLLLFLRPHPYDNWAKFEADIIEPWKRGNEEIAIQRLKTLFTAIALRRSKSVVELPPRVDIKRRLDFSTAEFAQYREAEAAVATMLDAAISTQTYTPSLYANALQRINRLRMICNLGAFVKLAKDEMNSIYPTDHWNADIAQGYFNDLVTVGSARCGDCGIDLESVIQDEGDDATARSGLGRLLKCMVLLCGTCFQKPGKQRGSRCYACGSLPPCPSAVISASRSFSETLPYASATSGSIEFPTKVKAVVEDVKCLPNQTKRYELILSFLMNYSAFIKTLTKSVSSFLSGHQHWTSQNMLSEWHQSRIRGSMGRCRLKGESLRSSNFATTKVSGFSC